MVRFLYLTFVWCVLSCTYILQERFMADQLIDDVNALQLTATKLLSAAGETPAEFDQDVVDVKGKALELLLAGKSVVETAKTIGTSRMTIYRWLKHDKEF